MDNIEQLRKQVEACTHCAGHLPEGPRPVIQISPSARILIAGHAPGRKVHVSGIPFADASGDRLRDWMDVSEAVFYDASKVALLPMGFCYPGTGKSGDNPPRPECADKWRTELLAQMPDIRLTLVIGAYAHKWHLGKDREKSLTQTVQNVQKYVEKGIIPLPHPSPRNNIWLKKNPWFESEVLPVLRCAVVSQLASCL
jgi:uracil-DNA glycosylase